MRILAVDTSAPTATAAIMTDSKMTGLYSLQTNTNSTTLLPMIESMLEKLQLDIQAFDLMTAAVGPGSFTGIRIGVATIKGYNLALGKKYIELNTLQAIALSANCGAKGSAIIDAGNGYYFADYTNNTSPCLIAYDDIRAQNAGTAKLASQYLDGLVELCRSKYSAGNFDDNLSPLYIRKSQAEENATKK